MVMIGEDPGFFFINFLLYLLSLHNSEGEDGGLLLLRDIECIDDYPFHSSSHNKQSADESRSYWEKCEQYDEDDQKQEREVHIVILMLGFKARVTDGK